MAATRPRLSSDQPRRPRNAQATREAILQSALAAFSRHGYDGIGVREIAQTAGVTAVLVNRYFGSKEELFAAAVEVAFADNSLFTGESTTIAKRLSAAVMTKTETHVEPNDAVLLLLRSAPNPRAAEILRESIARQFERPLRASLPGPKASERAATILALVAGVLLMRKVIRIKGLADANPGMLSSLLETLFQLVVGEHRAAEKRN
jgi:AcrR family transcriptional regulator